MKIFLSVLLATIFSLESMSQCDLIVSDGFATSCFVNGNPQPVYITYKLSNNNNIPVINANGDTITYVFNNCIPNLPKINQKVKEAYKLSIHNLSKVDSLIIITGSVYGNRKIQNTEIAIPDYFWTVVQSLSNKSIYYCILIKNDDNLDIINAGIQELQSMLNYKIPTIN